MSSLSITGRMALQDEEMTDTAFICADSHLTNDRSITANHFSFVT